MSDSYESLRRKMEGAGELESVVRTMKALAASSIGQYERAVEALTDYSRSIELGLTVCFRQRVLGRSNHSSHRKEAGPVGAVVFGSDQGLVGQFNDLLADFTVAALRELPGEKRIYAVGERIHARLLDAGLKPVALYAVPNSVSGITPLVGRILLDTEAHPQEGAVDTLFIFRNRPRSGALYQPWRQRLLPLDDIWLGKLAEVPWPTKYLPEVLGQAEPTLKALIHEYLFVSLFRACAESLASENASRLAAMQRAEKNIDELLETLTSQFHRLRQSAIDEELFDVISGFEALNGKEK